MKALIEKIIEDYTQYVITAIHTFSVYLFTAHVFPIAQAVFM